MRPLSVKTKKNLKDKCFICGAQPVEQHHSIIWGGRQIDEVFAIIPLCVYHHRGNSGRIWKEVQERCESYSIKEGLSELLIKYPKTDWEQRMLYLNKKYADKS